MQPTRTDGGVRLAGDARQRLHYARGYGRLVGDDALHLAPVEAAYLLYRGDVPDIDGHGFRSYITDHADPTLYRRFAVYKDLRERGFYLSPRVDGPIDFEVYERGSDPTGGPVAYEIRVHDERDRIAVQTLDPAVLGVVDGEGEVGYIAVDRVTLSGTVDTVRTADLTGRLAGTRVLVWNPPQWLYKEAFYGRPIADRDDVEDGIQLSLLEAHYLADCGAFADGPTTDRIAAAGRDHEGKQFPRRRAVYGQLRDVGMIPKTGYKFGTDFRVYTSFSTVEEMTHSSDLVRVLAPDAVLGPHDFARDVRLAHGVGKRMVFALAAGSRETDVSWIAMKRITP